MHVPNVVGMTRIEKYGILRDHTNDPMQTFLCYIMDILSINQDMAFIIL